MLENEKIAIERAKNEENLAKDHEWELKLEEIKKEEHEAQEKLQKQILGLEADINKKVDEFLQQGVAMDELKLKITLLKESEVKLQNTIDGLKEMNTIMHDILKKHEEDNKLLAKQLLTFKQQVKD